jgi:hypothetical protein
MWRLLVRSLKDIYCNCGAIMLPNDLIQTLLQKINISELNNTVKTEAGSLLVYLLQGTYSFKQMARLGFMPSRQVFASASFMTALR